MTGPATTTALFRCDGAAVPVDLERRPWSVDLPLHTWGDDPDLNLRIEGLAGKVFGAIDARAADLVRIAAYAYGADQAVSRGGLDVHRERWRRRMTLSVPVSEPAFWSAPETMNALTDALGFGTEDSWSFAFDQLAAEGGQLRLDLDDRPLFGEPDSVVLFSGGTDSLCALVEAYAERGARPIVVSHRSTPPADALQKDLLETVRHRFPAWQFPQMSFWIHRRGGDAADTSQRTRGFLFAALGAAVAGQIGVKSVLLADNGYVSVNPPINGQLVGALASRGTHPAFLRLVNRLVDLVFPEGVKIANPLAARTRAEALRVLPQYGAADLLDLTRSCGKHRGRPKDVPHCGGCSQCVDRRFAMLAAGLEEYDPIRRYGIDLFTKAIPEGEPRTIALSYVDFARKTERLDPNDLFDHYQELIACLDPDAPGFGMTAQRLGDLLRRHGGETVGVIARMYAELSNDLARGHLPATSLLALLGGRDDRSQPVPPTGRCDRPSNESSTVASNEIRHRLGVWHVAFRGEKGTYPHTKGMTQLALLLQSPKQPIDIVALARCEAVPASGRSVGEGFSAGIGGHLGPVLDDEAMRSVRKRERELPVLIRSARAAGRILEANELTEEIAAARKLLRSAQGLGGRPRQIGGTPEKARKGISKNIHACLDLIAVDQPVLHEHLLQFLHLGIPPSYDPDPPEHWRVEW